MTDTLFNVLGFTRAATINDDPYWEATIEGNYSTLRATIEPLEDEDGDRWYSGIGVERKRNDDPGTYHRMRRADWLALATICEHAIRRIDQLEESDG